MQPNPHVKYFKRRVCGDDVVPRPAAWGGSAIYYETSEEGFPIRQIQMFESGVVLAYDDEHYHDDYGWRDGNPIYTEPPVTVAITSQEFHRVWMRHHDAQNRAHTRSA